MEVDFRSLALIGANAAGGLPHTQDTHVGEVLTEDRCKLRNEGIIVSTSLAAPTVSVI